MRLESVIAKTIAHRVLDISLVMLQAQNKSCFTPYLLVTFGFTLALTGLKEETALLAHCCDTAFHEYYQYGVLFITHQIT